MNDKTLSEAVAAKRDDSPDGKLARMRDAVSGGSQKEERTYTDEYRKLLQDIPEWQDNDIASQEKAILHEAAGQWGLTQDEVQHIKREQIVELRNDVLQSLQATALDKKVEAAKHQAAVKNRGVANKEQVLAELAKSLGIK